MKINLRNILLLSAAVSCGVMMPHRSFALGGGGSGFGTIPSDNYTVSGVGPFSGTYNVSGGVDTWVTALNNASPTGRGHQIPFSLSEGEAFLHITKTAGALQMVYGGGQFQTPCMGLTSNNGQFNSVAPYGSPFNPRSPETFYAFLTYQPSPYFSISAGKMPSVEGVEFGIDYLNPSFFVSDLNNMELAPGYGPQLNLFYGPSTVNIEWSDSFTTGRHNMLSFSWVYNLNPSGSDYLIMFGHHNIGHTGNPFGPHSGIFLYANSTLIGLGGQWLSGNWSYIPEIEYQYLPKSAVSASSGEARPLKTYYNIALMTDITYQFDPNWSLNLQPQYVYQNGDKQDPNANTFGNWLQLGTGPAAGTFSPGTSMFGLQLTPTWQQQNFFVRATAAYTHINGFTPGTGYGKSGNAADQIVGVLEVGFLLGKV